uniref:surface glycan-binding family protein n=1 Tax=Alistipes sp. TaxID=1872444 RepID=UPI0040567AFE
MNKIINLLKGSLLALAVLFTAPAFVACEGDGLEQEGASLVIYYPEVSNIGPSMNYISGAPSVYGATPSLFSLSKIKFNNEEFSCDCFSINPSTGAITISNTENLTPGCYKLSVSCLVGSQPFRFEDIFVVNMLPAQPESIEVSRELVEIPYAEAAQSEETITITPKGESVSIINWALKQEEGKEYFSISKEGVISINPNFKGEILPGVYPLSVILSTHAGSTTYEEVATIKITSVAVELSYNPAAGRMEYNMGYTSNAPTMKGSPEEVSYAIKAVTPETDKIAIDPTTGVLSVEKDAELPVDGHYVVDVTVENLYGAVDFMEAFTLDVIAYIEPIDQSTFAYDTVEAIQGTAFEAPLREGLVGDEISFSFVELPADLEGQLSIDPATGKVSAEKGNTIPLGEYNVEIKAANTKNEATTTLVVKIIENPYFFTYIRYGNNLGLDPATHASQYRCATANEMKALKLTPQTDAKPGVELEWSVAIKHQCGSTTIDPTTGVLSPAGMKAMNGGLVLVTATAGKGKEGETSVTVPVFFSFMPSSGATVLYTPFVIQVNPRKGIVSAAPEVLGIDLSSLFMDYRRNFNYYNIGGLESHLDGQPSVAGSFMNQMWTAYYTSIGSATVNTGARGPMSWIDNKSNLSNALAYVDNADGYKLVVNPNKWIDQNNVAANGALIGQITYADTESSAGSGTQIFPIWIWFDEKF